MARTAKTKTETASPAGKSSSRTGAATTTKAASVAPKGKAKAGTPVALPRVTAAKASSKAKAATVAAQPTAPTRVPPPSKGELRAQIEKLEAANATLKIKRREMKRAAKLADSRIAELEAQLAAVKRPSEGAPPAEAKLRQGRSATGKKGPASPDPENADKAPEPGESEA